MHGFLHFLLTHASLLGHSLLLIHSGWQSGGFPINSGRQEQDGILFISLHTELGPQGDGTQGFSSSAMTGWSVKNK